MTLECHACGKRFRSMLAEARHRHNFPALCTRNKRFMAFIAENEKTRLIPPSLRKHVAEGGTPIYRLNRPDYDRVPVDTFLVRCEPGTVGRVPTTLLRVVRPNDPSKYIANKLTPGKRLLYACWRGGTAVKSLQDAKRDTYHHVVYPGEPGHDKIAAFKIACDAKRAWRGRPVFMKPALLLEALGIDPDEYRRYRFDIGDPLATL